jgi:hypothetical protein
MAILGSNGYTLEMTLRWDDIDGVVYDFVFKWQGKPIINEEVLKRSNEFWSRGPRHGLFFTEYAYRRPLRFLRDMLEATEPHEFSPTEPDVQIIVWPIDAMPHDHSMVAYESEDRNKEREEQEARKKQLSKLPNDLFQIEFFVDTYNFEGCSELSPDGITFRLWVHRSELESFVEELEQGREEIVRRYATNPEGHGSADWHDLIRANR